MARQLGAQLLQACTQSSMSPKRSHPLHISQISAHSAAEAFVMGELKA